MNINLAVIAEKLGKTATDIAKETGINRNTINSLMKGHVKDLRISTLEKIGKVYGLTLMDIIGDAEPVHANVSMKPEKLNRNIYKQEAELVPFTGWPWVASVSNGVTLADGTTVGYGQFDVYFSKDYGIGYWDLEGLRNLASAFYKSYGENKEAYAKLYRRYSLYASEIEEVYSNIHKIRAEKVTATEFDILFGKLREAYIGFWDTSLFIDAFDTGVDRERIDAIAKKYTLDKTEVETLTTPAEMTFADERKYYLLSLIKDFRKGRKIETSVFLRKHRTVLDEYRKKFDYYKSNYVHVNHISENDIENEVGKYLNDVDLFKTDYERLEHYAENKQTKIRAVQKAHHLRENPLGFFGAITFWREHRKKVNLMGIHALDFILSVLEERTGIAKKLLRYLNFDEVGNVAKGLIPVAVLERRYRDSMLITVQEHGYKIFEGPEAASIKESLESALLQTARTVSAEVINGQTASQGYAKGAARIVMTLEDFGKFKEGEILVTSMTRPEFVPLMKIAAAIVTNEGGITCHAAIVSRELGKPCVIATKVATQMIKDGDIVEVRANHGTVRILR